jgi:NADH dehydrogenase FAD-containing subunit
LCEKAFRSPGRSDHTNRQEQLPAIPAIVVPSGNCDLDAGKAAFSLRSIFRNHANVNVNLGEVISADLLTRTVHTRDGKTYEGDWLVLAAGAQVNFFGTPGADKHAYPLYSLRDCPASSILSGQRQLEFPILFERYQQQSGL